MERLRRRSRFFISSLHTEEELTHTLDVLAEELAKIRTASKAQPQPRL